MTLIPHIPFLAVSIVFVLYVFARALMYGVDAISILIVYFQDRSLLKKKRLATKRARKLLKEWVTPEQFAEYEKNGSILVKGGTTGHYYRVASLIVREDDNRHWFCFLPGKSAYDLSPPSEDVLLARIIMLQCGEMQALKVAQGSTGVDRFSRLSDAD